ncbi:glycosyltransferase family 39 protein [Ottowia testudinis]|uniref:Glycosyltransferase family 39 protein n=1 Tax=Ottowia testudinis TaxID=2816950 RepID=A0A975H404_9BURK|nr:glycosyltransferase family 39 protein [Ottowia testudinis]QTD45840.1 glycosyltransferase family 39 protein [Ottowia testudinis]
MNAPALPDTRRPGAAVTVAVALFAALWWAVLLLTQRTPPIDNVEQWVWSHGLAWGYYKHPPLPSWIAAAAQAVLGRAPWVIDLLGAACGVVTFVIFWRLLRRMRGAAFATLALLAVLCLTYSTQRLNYFNHNTVLMPLAAAVIALSWRVTLRPSRWTWGAIGALLGLGLLAKYQMVLVVVCVTLWWLRIGGWRGAEHRWGALLGGAAALAVFVPHLVWLVQSGWVPLNYARASALGAHLPWGARPVHVFHWMADWFGNRLMPAWVLLAIASWALARMPADAPASAPGHPGAALSRPFLLLWGLGPLLLMMAMSLATGSRLPFKWSTSFALWTVPAVMACLPLAAALARVRALPWPVGAGFAALQLMLLVAMQHGAHQPTPIGPSKKAREWRQRDFAPAARVLDAQARAELGGPAQIISGAYGVAGALAQQLPGHPLVLIDGDLGKSPWLRADDLRDARVMWVEPACGVPAGAQALMPGWIVWPLPPGAVLQGRAPTDPRRWHQAMAQGGVSIRACP